jgi:hypothetical protein
MMLWAGRGSIRARFARVEGGKGSCRVDLPVTRRHDRKRVRHPHKDQADENAPADDDMAVRRDQAHPDG